MCVVDSVPRPVLSQDFQDQAIPGQETEAESSYSPVDSDENVIKSGTTPREDIGEDPIWVYKESHMKWHA